MPAIIVVVIAAGARELDQHLHDFGRLIRAAQGLDHIGHRKTAIDHVPGRHEHAQLRIDLGRVDSFHPDVLPGAPKDRQPVALRHVPPRPGLAQQTVKGKVAQRGRDVDAPDVGILRYRVFAATGDVEFCEGERLIRRRHGIGSVREGDGVIERLNGQLRTCQI
ncbi:hypothetical protein PS681_06172 [Pseudomonas fluorescens]|nr:hypothetical protein PS681_06172 [Pseudomonas fluorescens]